MCGIAGCYQQADGRKLVDIMTDRIAHRGPDAALHRFRDMFAFAIADERTGELVLVRDSLGIKPLYYLRRGAGTVFASELAAGRRPASGSRGLAVGLSGSTFV
jgi:asparagine synthase (glutamine-hydrolysing)